jgi:excisionase family DNA binding protein
MSTADANFPLPVTPTSDDTVLARESGSKLARVSKPRDISLVVRNNGAEESVSIPQSAFDLLTEILNQMAQGNAVTVVPECAYATLQDAALLLNVSKPYVGKLIDDGVLPARGTGEQRRIPFSALLDYRQRSRAVSLAAFAELTAQAQELGLGYGP